MPQPLPERDEADALEQPTHFGSVISLIIVAKEVQGDRKVEILNAKETKYREKRSGTAVHTQTTEKS